MSRFICCYADSRQAKCHYFECVYVECHGASFILKFQITLQNNFDKFTIFFKLMSTEAVFLVMCDPSMNEL